MADSNTLLLRLEAPLQAWGVTGKMVHRPTEMEPSKSGVVGMLACALGIKRDNPSRIGQLAKLAFAVRVDREGSLLRDYHTIGAGIGNRSADGKIKRTGTTKELETLISVRTYLEDASFVVALQGEPELIEECARALEDPVWTYYLGRKSCPPAAPVLIGTAEHPDLLDALQSVAWQKRFANETVPDALRAQIEATPADDDATSRNDHPEYFWRAPDHQFAKHWPRFVQEESITGFPVDEPTWHGAAKSDQQGYSTKHPVWNGSHATTIRKRALRLHGETCVLTGMPMDEVHHVEYPDDIPGDVNILDDPAWQERINLHVKDDLRPLSRLAHEAITMIEYRLNMGKSRIDPLDPKWQPRILSVIDQILSQRTRPTRRAGARRR